MKELTLICTDCHKTKTFYGYNIDEIIKQIDESKWHDGPEYTLCPKCDNNQE